MATNLGFAVDKFGQPVASMPMVTREQHDLGPVGAPVVLADGTLALADGTIFSAGTGLLPAQSAAGATAIEGASTDALDIVFPDGTLGIGQARTFTAADVGTSYYACPACIALTATLTAGTSTTVLVEALNKDGVTVSTAATFTCDTVNQELSATILMRDTLRFRVRRSSGTGTVSIHLER